MSQVDSTTTAATTYANVLEENIKKTIDLLSRIIKKPPLTIKLLSKPPFRYLHDIFSQVIQVTDQNIAFAKGLYSELEMNSENIKDKEAKVAYLQKMISMVALITNVEIRANPLKIVAGMDPEDTNILLQLVAKIVLKKIDTSNGVKRVLAGEVPKKKTVEKKKDDGPHRPPAPTQEIKQDKQQPLKNNPNKSETESRAPPQREEKKDDRREERAREEKREEKLREDRSREEKNREERAREEKIREERAREDRAREERPDTRVQREDQDGPKEDSNIRTSITEKHDDKEESHENEEERVERVRPKTARAAPPKVRRAEAAVAETVASVIIQDGENQSEESETEEVVEQEATANNDADDGQDGKLVKLLKKDGGKKEEKKEDKDDRKAKSSLRDAVQLLCKHTHPTAKALDYLQEDIDAMNKELLFWRNESALMTTALSELGEEEEKVFDDSEVVSLLQSISSLKATIIQNNKNITRLLANVAAPVK